MLCRLRTQNSNYALFIGTIAFVLCFSCWVINAVLITFLDQVGIFHFDESQFGCLLAAPVLSGSVVRLPLGMLTDRYGGHIVFSILLAVAAVPMYLLGQASDFTEFLFASLGFGVVGGSFAVGVGYVSPWFSLKHQGTALGIFGMGNVGAALTTMLAPSLLNYFTKDGQQLEGWSNLPRLYAILLLLSALMFFITAPRHHSEGQMQQHSFKSQLRYLKDIVMWRLGLYYFLVFGSFVALAQWLIPYIVNVYGTTVVMAGMLATVFTLPAGIIRIAGGYLSDLFGARTVMNWVFISCIISCTILSVPKMEIESPGPGITAKKPGTVTSVSPSQIVTDKNTFSIKQPPTISPAKSDDNSLFLPKITIWQHPIVKEGDKVIKDQLLAKGITNIYYPANLWLFMLGVFVFGVATGIGKGGVYRLIPEQFPHAVGTVGGMVGFLGALGGGLFPLLFGYLFNWSGLWASCWVVLLLLSFGCYFWMHSVLRGIMREEAPDFAEILERRRFVPLSEAGKTEVKNAINQQTFFVGMSDEELQRLTAIGDHVEYEAKDVIFKEGDLGDTMYVVLEGQVDMVFHDAQGETLLVAEIKQREHFGELALIDGQPRSATAVAKTACRLFRIQRRDFFKLLSKDTGILTHLLVSLTRKVRQQNVKVVSNQD